MNTVIQLGDIASVVMGQAPPGKDCNKEGNGYPFVKAGEFSGDRPVVREWTTNPLKKAKDGDVLVCVVGATAGKINLGIDCAIGRSVAAVRPLPERLYTNYLHHFLRTKTLVLRHGSQGLAQGVITREMLLGLEIPLPPLEEQRRIAAILDKTNEINRFRECYQALCRDLELSIFYKEFGSPGANPFGWPTIPLAEMAEIFSDGPFGSNLKSSHYVESGIRVVRLQNIGIGAFLDYDQAFIDPLHYETIKKHSCLPGDVLIGTLGDPNLRACILPDGIPVAVNKADCIQMRCDTSRSTTAYITHLLNLPEVNQMASSLILGQTRGRISMGRLKGFVVPMPPLEKQIQFARKIGALNSLRKIGESSASSIRDLIDSYSSWALAPKECNESHRSQAPRNPEKRLSVHHSDLSAHLFMDAEGMPAALG
jgi:type I restriction enzyme S subunit